MESHYWLDLSFVYLSANCEKFDIERWIFIFRYLQPLLFAFSFVKCSNLLSYHVSRLLPFLSLVPKHYVDWLGLSKVQSVPLYVSSVYRVRTVDIKQNMCRGRDQKWNLPNSTKSAWEKRWAIQLLMHSLRQQSWLQFWYKEDILVLYMENNQPIL